MPVTLWSNRRKL